MPYEEIKKQYNKAHNEWKKILFGAKERLLKLNWSERAVFLLLILAILSLSFFWISSAIEKRGDTEIKKQIIDSQDVKENFAGENDEIPAHYIRRRLDGVYVEPFRADYYPVAVMIDNDPAARPQSGLAKAQVVYEAKAESGISRFLAVFADGAKLEEVGPIRSARPYYVDWSEGYNALYVHVGGSPEALNILAKTKMLNLNEFYQGGYFWRSNNKVQPHNVYSSTDNFNKYLDRLNVKNSGYEAWKYKDDNNVETHCDASPRDGCQNIEINFSVQDYLVRWEYDKENNNYARYMGAVLHKDADGSQIKAKNIIIMKVAARVIDEELRRRMTTIGEGKAWYCFDGRCETGKWKKPDNKTREKIYDDNGLEVEFNAGTTWIEIVQNDNELLMGN